MSIDLNAKIYVKKNYSDNKNIVICNSEFSNLRAHDSQNQLIAIRPNKKIYIYLQPSKQDYAKGDNNVFIFQILVFNDCALLEYI